MRAEVPRPPQVAQGLFEKRFSRFPDELSGASGFVNSANTLFLQPTLMERYIAVAERIVEIALPARAAATTEVNLQTRELIFVATPGFGASETEAAGRVLRRFLTRAHRRPPSDDEVARAIGQYRQSGASMSPRGYW